jgi:hypothetical protein
VARAYRKFGFGFFIRDQPDLGVALLQVMQQASSFKPHISHLTSRYLYRISTSNCQLISFFYSSQSFPSKTFQSPISNLHSQFHFRGLTQWRENPIINAY